MNGTEELALKQGASRQPPRNLVGNHTVESATNERPTSPSNLVIVSVTCSANEIWNGSSSSSDSTVDSNNIISSKEVAPKPEVAPNFCSNQISPIRIIVNKRSKMPAVSNKAFIVSSSAASKDSIAAISNATHNNPSNKQLQHASSINIMGNKASTEAIVDSKTELNIKTNHIKCGETDCKPNGIIVEDKADHKTETTVQSKSVVIDNAPTDDTKTLAEAAMTKESTSPISKLLADDRKASPNLSNQIVADKTEETESKSAAFTSTRSSTRKRSLLTRVTTTERRVSQRQQTALKLKEVAKLNEQDTQILNEISEEPLPIPPITSPLSIKRRYMRKIIPDELSENSISDIPVTITTPEKVQPVLALTSDDPVVNTPESVINNAAESVTTSPVRTKKKKGFHRLRELEDLVWVKISGRPWWPAQVTLDPQNNTFKRNKISAKRASSYMSEYHVTTFGKTPTSSWVLANYLLDFRGKKQFEDYVIQLKRPIPVHTPLYAQIKWRFHVKESLREEWEKVVKDTEDNYKTEIQDQREKDFLIPVVPKKVKKRYFEPTDNLEIVKKKKKMIENDEELDKGDVSKNSKSLIQKANKKRKSDVLEETEMLVDMQKGKENVKKIAKNKDPGNNKCGQNLDGELEIISNGSKLGRFLSKNKGEMKKKSKVNQQTEIGTQKKKSKGPEEQSVVPGTTENLSNGQETISTGKPKSRKQTVNGLTPTKKSVDRNVEKVCHLCEIMIMNEPTVRCHGICKSVVHVACAIPLASDVLIEEYKCETCITGNHVCFICKKNDGDIRPCRANYCGKLYHADCLESFRSSRIDEQTVLCPAHACMSCTLSYSRALPFNGNRSYRCIRCPFAYHANDACLPAGSLILSNSVIICPRHYSPKPVRRDKTQHVNVNWCFVCSNGGSLICCESCPASFHAECLNIEPPEGNYYCCECQSGMQPKYGDIVWVKLGSYRWWPAKICNPKTVPINIRNLPHTVGEFPVCFFGTNDFHWTSRSRVFHFLEGDQGAHITSSSSSSLAKRFQIALSEACEAFKEWKAARDVFASRYNNSISRPPYYKHIVTNRPYGKVTMHTANLSMMTPCECDPNSENPCGSDTECLNRMLMFECHPAICLAGERCNNQRFQKRQYPAVETFQSEGKGWGLRCLTDIKKGDFVNEYVGEIIDEEECRRRMKKMHEENNTSYYFLTIDKDRIIDAAHKGNLSRFMNHSCRPNNETRKWTVNGDTRVGLFALCDIPSGTELTFNYNLDCLGNEKILCKCGELNCSIYIGERPKVLKPSSKKKADIVRKKRKKSRLSKIEHDDLCFRCGEDGHLVLCDRKGCTKAFHLDCLDMKKTPHGRWECPWHHCYHCGKPSSALCLICPNSFCKDHTAGNISILKDGSIYCNEHTDEATTSADNITEASSTEPLHLDKNDTGEHDVDHDETNPENSETNSTSCPSVKLNGAKVLMKKVKKKSSSAKRLTSARKRRRACGKTSVKEKTEEINAKVDVSKEIKTESEIDNANINCNSVSNKNKSVVISVDSSTLPQETKLNPVKRRSRTSTLKNGMIESGNIVKVTTRSRTQNQLAYNQLVNCTNGTNQSKAKLQLEEESIVENEMPGCKEKLPDVKTSLQEMETDKETIINTSIKDKLEEKSATDVKMDDHELEMVEKKVNEESSQIHCQDIIM